mmetsp:Transcript_70823/g.153805  ORF Transcript_70823/g.153805 Transcript_70823/m.153805 type:complete len:281 (-) Transcript_70823:511-1353(-)
MPRCFWSSGILAFTGVLRPAALSADVVGTSASLVSPGIASRVPERLALRRRSRALNGSWGAPGDLEGTFTSALIAVSSAIRTASSTAAYSSLPAEPPRPPCSTASRPPSSPSSSELSSTVAAALLAGLTDLLRAPGGDPQAAGDSLPLLPKASSGPPKCARPSLTLPSPAAGASCARLGESPMSCTSESGEAQEAPEGRLRTGEGTAAMRPVLSALTSASEQSGSGTGNEGGDVHAGWLLFTVSAAACGSLAACPVADDGAARARERQGYSAAALPSATT